MTGIGGDCFGMVSVPGKPVWGYNGSGRAGARASIDALMAQGVRHHRAEFGACRDRAGRDRRLGGNPRRRTAAFSLDRALAPAIRYAEGGFPVAARLAWDWTRCVGKLRADPGAARHYLFEGRAPAEGDIVKLPALAQIARDGRGEGPARVLRRADRAGHGGDRGRPRLLPHRRGLRRSPRRGGHAHRHELSRPRCPGVAAQHARA